MRTKTGLHERWLSFPIRTGVILLLAAVTLSSCVPFRSRNWQPRTGREHDLPPLSGVPFNGALVGVGASGGGSRAARFEAAVYRKLWQIEAEDANGLKRPLMSEVDFLSSVSGGSISAAWYATHKPPGPVIPGTPAGDTFWADYLRHMEVNLEARAALKLFNPINWIRFAGNYGLTDLMSEQLDESLYQGALLGTLSERAADPASQIPRLLINSTVYRDPLWGQPLDASQTDEQTIYHWGRKLVHTPLTSNYFMTSLDLSRQVPDLEILTPTELGADPGSELVARAVMSSAAFPLVFAPVLAPVFRDPSTGRKEGLSSSQRVIELGDGGLYDNYGIETLVQLFTADLRFDESRRALILVLDGSPPYGFNGTRLTEMRATVAIMGNRAQTMGRLLLEMNAGKYLTDACKQSRLRILWISFHDPGVARKDPALARKLSAISTRLSINASSIRYLDQVVDVLFAPDFHSELNDPGPKKGDGSSPPSLAASLQESLKWASLPAPRERCPETLSGSALK